MRAIVVAALLLAASVVAAGASASRASELTRISVGYTPAAARSIRAFESSLGASLLESLDEIDANDSTIQLAHTLGATVVAEGVETTTQLERLTTLGCDTAQGYLIGYPQPPEQLTALLTAASGNATMDLSRFA